MFGSKLFAKKLVLGTLAVLFALVVTAPASAVNCGDTVYSNTTLTHDLIGCPGNGLTVGASGITLDLRGHQMVGTGTGIGVEIATGIVDVEILGPGEIRGFDTGIHAVRSHGLTVGEVSLTLNVNHGLFWSGVDDSVVRDSEIQGNRIGITLTAISSAPTARVQLIDNQVGSCTGSRGAAISVTYGDQIYIARNAVKACDYGIDLVGTSRSHVEKNRISDVAESIDILGLGSPSTGNVILKNEIERAGVGVLVWGRSGNIEKTQIRENTIHLASYGLYIADPGCVKTSHGGNALSMVVNSITDLGTLTADYGNTCDGSPC